MTKAAVDNMNVFAFENQTEMKFAVEFFCCKIVDPEQKDCITVEKFLRPTFSQNIYSCFVILSAPYLKVLHSSISSRSRYDKNLCSIYFRINLYCLKKYHEVSKRSSYHSLRYHKKVGRKFRSCLLETK